MNNLTLICYDFETAGKIAYDPYTCYPIQVAAMAIDPVKLEILPNGTFQSMMKPQVDDEKEWDTAGEDWKQALDINKKTLKEIKEAPLEGEVWKSFVKFVNGFNPKGTQYTAPIGVGQNIDRFDWIVADRLNRRHKIKQYEGQPLLFNTRQSIDFKNIIFMWFEGNNELKNYKMDTIRPYFGISGENRHDAMSDVIDTAELVIRFLKLHRKLFNSIPFKGSFKNSSIGVSPDK